MELVKYNAAKKALAEAKQVDEVKGVLDVATAMKAYARQANDKQLEIDASEIRIRAERRLGEMLKQQKETVGLAKPGPEPRSVPEENRTPTLADVGISKKLSSRSQAIAGIPAEEFEATLAEHREEQQAVTASTMDKLARKAHVAHNSGENEWYTPSQYIEAARRVMGGIDCDPASSKMANKTVGADVFYTKDDDGLAKPWNGRVWMNPPYAQPLMSQFAEAVALKFESGEISEAIVLVNNATETAWFQRMASVASVICFPKGRVRFIDIQGNPGAPLQGQAILYFGKKVDLFTKEFSSIGFCGAIIGI